MRGEEGRVFTCSLLTAPRLLPLIIVIIPTLSLSFIYSTLCSYQPFLKATLMFSRPFHYVTVRETFRISHIIISKNMISCKYSHKQLIHSPFHLLQCTLFSHLRISIRHHHLSFVFPEQRIRIKIELQIRFLHVTPSSGKRDALHEIRNEIHEKQGEREKKMTSITDEREQIKKISK